MMDIVVSYYVSFSVTEEDMRSMLVSSSPLTTSVNAITWQDYIGTCIIILLVHVAIPGIPEALMGVDNHYAPAWGGYLVDGGVLATTGGAFTVPPSPPEIGFPYT